METTQLFSFTPSNPTEAEKTKFCADKQRHILYKWLNGAFAARVCWLFSFLKKKLNKSMAWEWTQFNLYWVYIYMVCINMSSVFITGISLNTN